MTIYQKEQNDGLERVSSMMVVSPPVFVHQQELSLLLSQLPQERSDAAGLVCE